MPEPTGTPEYAQESLPERAGYFVETTLDGASRADTALGPAEAAFTYLACALAGGLASLIPVVIFRNAWLLMVSFPVGIIGGLLLAIPIRGIRLGKRRRLGIIGATVLAILTLCVACGSVGMIAGFQKMGEADRLTQMAEDAGLGTYNEPSVTAPASAPICWGGLILLGIGTVCAVGLNLLIKVIRR